MEDIDRDKTGIEIEGNKEKIGYFKLRLWKDGIMIKEQECLECWKSLDFLNKEMDLGLTQIIAFKRQKIEILKEEISKLRRTK